MIIVKQEVEAFNGDLKNQRTNGPQLMFQLVNHNCGPFVRLPWWCRVVNS